MAIGDELSSLDYSAMIGGPLIAVVKAQAQAATTTVDFIKSVGFTGEGANISPLMVTFSYDRPAPKKDADGKPTGEYEVKKFNLQVPFLTMVPIPNLRIEEVKIDFNAKINSVQESTSASSHDLNAQLTAKGGWGPVSAELKVGYAYKKSNSQGEKTERTYSMSVSVKATQDELPEGTSRLLSILEGCIKEVPATT